LVYRAKRASRMQRMDKVTIRRLVAKRGRAPGGTISTKGRYVEIGKKMGFREKFPKVV